jgi:hypothetical protein
MRLFALILVFLLGAALLLAVPVIAHRPPRSPDCTGRLMTFAGPHGQAVQCVCFAGTLSTCFDPGP